MAKHDIVLVTWTDAVRSPDEVSAKEKPVQCQTVGYLLKKTASKVVLAMDKNKDQGYRMGFTIPSDMVKEVKVLWSTSAKTKIVPGHFNPLN